eukprot:477309_1
MGITGLLQALKPITRTAHLSEFHDKTCGVDISCILHRGAYGSAIDLVLYDNAFDQIIAFVFKFLKQLSTYNITAILVFDGDQLPLKCTEEQSRSQSRKENRELAIQAYNVSNQDACFKYAAKAITITSSMVTALINKLIQKSISFIVAPFEADAQLGYMYQSGEIDFVISEDSDLLLFGVRECLYKFDMKTQMGQLIQMEQLKFYSPSVNKTTDICGYLKKCSGNQIQFIEMCVLSGCDYLTSIKGIGLKTSVKLWTKYKHLKNIMVHLEKTKSIPVGYSEHFKRACAGFYFQTVYDRESKSLKHLNSSSTKYPLTNLDFVGKQYDNYIAQQIAEGIIDPRSKQIRISISAKSPVTTLPDSTIIKCLKLGYTDNQIASVLDEIERDNCMYRNTIKENDDTFNFKIFFNVLDSLFENNDQDIEMKSMEENVIEVAYDEETFDPSLLFYIGFINNGLSLISLDFCDTIQIARLDVVCRETMASVCFWRKRFVLQNFTKLKLLYSMGFTHAIRNIGILHESKGDINVAVDFFVA